MSDTVINFRCDKETAERAKARFESGAVKFPDLLRVAVSAIAAGEATVFNEILRESVLGAAGGVNSAWLYHTCHSLFEYRDGVLYAKRNKGSRQSGDPVEVSVVDGVRSVVINSQFYPVKDIIWLMFYGYVGGEVVSMSGDSERISDLEIAGGSHQNVIIFHQISAFESAYIRAGKQRFVLFESGKVPPGTEAALERLYMAGDVFYLRLCDESEGRLTRSAINAIKLSDWFIVSIS